MIQGVQVHSSIRAPRNEALPPIGKKASAGAPPSSLQTEYTVSACHDSEMCRPYVQGNICTTQKKSRIISAYAPFREAKYLRIRQQNRDPCLAAGGSGQVAHEVTGSEKNQLTGFCSHHEVILWLLEPCVGQKVMLLYPRRGHRSQLSLIYPEEPEDGVPAYASQRHIHRTEADLPRQHVCRLESPLK